MKYKWVFDPDKKRLGFYNNKISEEEKKINEKKKDIKIYIILIVTAVVFIVVLIVFINEFFIKKFRKIRLNEITEEFVYE